MLTVIWNLLLERKLILNILDLYRQRKRNGASSRVPLESTNIGSTFEFRLLLFTSLNISRGLTLFEREINMNTI